MKKVALSLLAFGLIGAAAFAQDAPKVTIGDWGRQIIGFGSSADGYWINSGASWGATPRIVGLNIQAKTDTAGFSITPQADSGSFGLTDQNKAWINPLPGLTVESGINLETDTWRGVHDFGSYNWLRFSKEKGDGITFSRLGGGGFASDVNYNKDGIGAWALIQHAQSSSTTSLTVDTTTGSTAQPVDSTTTTTSGDAKNIGAVLQLGGAYTIPSIGTIKAQYIGNNVNSDGFQQSLFGSVKGTDPWGIYEVAFNLSAVKDLYEEIGVTIPSKSAAAGYTYQVSDLLGYTMDKITINAQVIAVGYTDDNGGVAGLGLGGGLGFDYDLGDSVGVSADLRYENPLAASGGADDGADPFTGFSIGFTKGFSNGLIGIGFEYATKYGFAFGSADATAGSWVVPVRLEEWF